MYGQMELASKPKDLLDNLLALKAPSGFPPLTELVYRDPKKGSRFICKICKEAKLKNHAGNIKNLVGHFHSKSHSSQMEKNDLKELDRLISSFFKPTSPKVSNLSTQDRENEDASDQRLSDDKMLKIELTAFLIKENMPFSKGSTVLEFIKDIITKYDHKVILDNQISKETISRISKDCIGASLKHSIFEELKVSPFSLSIDEASDFYKNSYLALCAKFLPSGGAEKPTTKLVSIIEMKGEKTDEALKNVIKEEILLKDPQISQNFMGLVTDEARSMVDSHIGLGKLLEKEYPHIICREDLSHKFNLICKALVKKLPSDFMQIIGNITSYFRSSCQRRYKLRAIQESLNKSSILDIIKYTEVRWLSLSQCLNRILDLWEPLKICFEQSKEFEELERLSTKNHLQIRIVADLLSYIIHYNLIFQKSDMLFDEIILTLEESLRVFGNLVFEKQFTHQEILDLLPEDASDVRLLDYYSLDIHTFTAQWLSSHGETDRIYKKYEKELQEKEENLRSSEVSETFNSVNSAENEQNLEILSNKPEEILLTEKRELIRMFESLKDWILEILIMMKQKLHKNDSLSHQVRVIFLENFDKEAWDNLRVKFPNIISQEKVASFQLELCIFKANFAKHKEDHKCSGKTILYTWMSLEAKYPNMAQLAKALLVLPSSTVPV